jgi:uncharacterized protein
MEQARAWYDENDPVHGFDHIVRVSAIACRLAEALGADVEVVRAAALLHDASGALPGGTSRASHEDASAAFARMILREEGWPPERIEAVAHCIHTHRFRGDQLPESLEAKVLFDADKLDVVGAFGVARTIGYAVQAGTPLFAEPSSSFLEGGETEPSEPHSAYHEYLIKLRKVKDRMYTRPAQEIAARRSRLLERFFKQLASEARLQDMDV